MALFTHTPAPAKSFNAATSLIALAALVGLLYYGRDFFVTLIVAAVFAFILDPAVLLVMKLRIPRPAAAGVVIGIAFVGLYLLTVIVWSQVASLSEDLPVYTARVNELFDKANAALDGFEKKTVETLVPKSLREEDREIQEKPQQTMNARKRRTGKPPQVPETTPAQVQEVRIRPEPRPLIATLYGYAAGYFHVLIMASFVPFLVYFMLSWRDHISNSVLRLFRGEDRYAVGKSWSGIGDSTRAYVLGNFFLWVFLSSFSAMVFFVLGVPYWLLIGPLSAFLSLIPYVGLPLAILPPVMAALGGPARFKILFVIALLTAALHIFAMNFLYAKIIGRRVRLNPLVVTIAIMFWGGVWGGIGLILAVPITGAIKAVCDNVESLEPYGQLLGD